jgi:PAS domain S-box-containing protein
MNKFNRQYDRQVAELFRHAPSTIALSFAGAVVAFAVLIDTGDSERGMLWFAFAVAILLLRVGTTWSYFQRSVDSPDPASWVQLILIANVLAGVQWGLLGTVLFPAVSGYRELFTVLLIAGVVAGSIPAYASIKWAHSAMALPAAVPPIFYVFTLNGGVQWVPVLFASLFLATVMYYAHRQHRLVLQRIENELLSETQIAEAKTANLSLVHNINQLEHRTEVAKRAQSQTRARVDILATHVERTLLPVIECDRFLNLVEWNKAAASSLGYSSDEMRGQNLASLLLPTAKNGSVGSFIDSLFANNSPDSLDTVVKTREGKRVPARLYFTPILAAEGIPLRIAVIMTEMIGEGLSPNRNRRAFS